ncbi:MAG: hypothetical protein KGQ94_10675 [Alphaproteobacteria bacterium]|nr:hypothetical protein [Alphaproteobacteria bacterium]
MARTHQLRQTEAVKFHVIAEIHPIYSRPVEQFLAGSFLKPTDQSRSETTIRPGVAAARPAPLNGKKMMGQTKYVVPTNKEG